MVLHPALSRFVDEMQKRLEEQMPIKGDLGWRGLNGLGFDELGRRAGSHRKSALTLMLHIARGNEPMTKVQRDAILKDLSDAANYIMMIADKVMMGELDNGK